MRPSAKGNWRCSFARKLMAWMCAVAGCWSASAWVMGSGSWRWEDEGAPGAAEEGEGKVETEGEADAGEDEEEGFEVYHDSTVAGCGAGHEQVGLVRLWQLFHNAGIGCLDLPQHHQSEAPGKGIVERAGEFVDNP